MLVRSGGHAVGMVGDGCFATFDSPASAIRCACAIREAVKALGLDVRVGVHAGEVEPKGEEVTGITVHIGCYVMRRAGPGEVLVSRTVKELVAGSGITFTDRGTHTLNGLPGEWPLFSPEPDPLDARPARRPHSSRPWRQAPPEIAPGTSPVAPLIDEGISGTTMDRPNLRKLRDIVSPTSAGE